MKRALLLTAFFIASLVLMGQQSNWHVYRPGGFSARFCYSNDELWIVSGAGIMRWNTITDHKTQYDFSNSPAIISSMGDIITAQDGSIWACGTSGVLHHDGLGWESFDSTNSPLPSTGISRIAQDASGALWIGAQSGVFRFHQGNWTAFDSSNSNLPSSHYVFSLTMDNNNRVWMGCSDGVWNYYANIWVHYTNTNSSLPNSTINSIAFQSDGTGWFVNTTGVARYQNGTWEQYAVLHGISVTNSNSVYVDYLQRVWICGDNSLLCLIGDSFQNYPRTLFADYSCNFYNAYVDDNQNIWLSFFDTYSPLSLVKFNGTSITRYPICEMPLPSQYLQAIFEGFDGKLWLGTADSDGIGGYLSINGNEVETFGMYNTNMPCDHVWSLAQDSQLNMWVGTCIGILQTGPAGSYIHHSSDTGVGASFVNTICAVDDEVWIGTGDGVSRFLDGNWSVLSSAETGMNLSDTKIIKQDSEGSVWIGCGAGIATRQNGVWTTYTEVPYVKDIAFGPDEAVWVARGQLSYLQDGAWHHYDTSNSPLVMNNTISVAVDNYGVVWAGTTLQHNCLYRLENGVWRTYDSTNSVINSQINCIYVDSHNTKWIGSRYLVLFNETGIPSETEDLLMPRPSLLKNYPNPFQESTAICYDKSSTSPVRISIYNLKGQKLWEHLDGENKTGKKEVIWPGRDKQGKNCAAGIYLIKVEDQGQTRFGKAVKLR